jgi:hypothetical protein
MRNCQGAYDERRFASAAAETSRQWRLRGEHRQNREPNCRSVSQLMPARSASTAHQRKLPHGEGERQDVVGHNRMPRDETLNGCHDVLL